MTPSAGEIEAAVRRAARGAGLGWGLADEAGRAVRWLEGHGLPGLAALCDLLEGVPACALGTPPHGNRDWSATAGLLCPLATGAVLVDHRATLSAGVRVGPVARPLLLLPFLVQASAPLGLRLDWPGVAAWSDGAGLYLAADPAARDATETDRVRISAGDRSGSAVVRSGRRPVDDTLWRRLAAIGHRTFAPATEASRLSGAGAGLNDND